MHLRSLGLATDLELAKTRGQVIDRDGYLVVQTPDEPSYYFGNLLVLPAAPQVGEVAYWTRKFASELGGDPMVRHVALRWDGIHGDAGATDELTAAGFTVEVLQVMTAPSLAAAPCAHEIRTLEPRDLVAAAELEYAIGDRHDDSFRRFLHRRAAWKQKLLSTGRATFWGAFDRSALIGSVGIVDLGARARYQDVQTAVAYRRQGVASALLTAAARASSADVLVIVAEPNSAAAHVYENVGFRTIERVGSACRYPGASE
ncbi:MAG: GNAT family N-acetyltransferase [Deltaproteobacteria bacterium]|nr:GNAT family N-acetyltransferase [Deltaproteobacteria bacterium]